MTDTKHYLTKYYFGASSHTIHNSVILHSYPHWHQKQGAGAPSHYGSKNTPNAQKNLWLQGSSTATSDACLPLPALEYQPASMPLGTMSVISSPYSPQCACPPWAIVHARLSTAPSHHWHCGRCWCNGCPSLWGNSACSPRDDRRDKPSPLTDGAGGTHANRSP